MKSGRRKSIWKFSSEWVCRTLILGEVLLEFDRVMLEFELVLLEFGSVLRELSLVMLEFDIVLLVLGLMTLLKMLRFQGVAQFHRVQLACQRHLARKKCFEAKKLPRMIIAANL